MQIFRRFYQVFGRQSRPAVRVSLLVLCASALLTASASATPAEEISSAVVVHGVADITAAPPKQFLKAFTAVAMRAPPRELPDYVIAAINLRSDLAPNIVAVAIKAAVKNWEEMARARCAIIDRITRAAIAANPDAVLAVVKGAASASPQSRHCIVSAAISAAPHEKEAILRAATARALPFAFLTFSSADHSGFFFTAPTLNPANISERVNSPEQPPTP